MTRVWRFVSSRAGVATITVLVLAGMAVGAWHFVASPGGLTLISLLVVAALSIGSRCVPRLHFQLFEGGAEGDGSGRPAMFRAMIRAELHRLAEESARLPGDRALRLDHAGPYEDHYALGAMGDGLSPLYKLLSAVTGQLIDALPSRARLVSAFLVPSATAILGIETVQGQVERMATIKWDDLGFPPIADNGKADNPDDLAQLAMPAAAWILLTWYEHAHLGGTHDWASYVDFVAGCAWEARGNLTRAEERYRAACADPANRAAAINLARIERLDEQDSGAAQDDPANRVSYQRLSRIVGDSALSPDDPQWYRGRYLLSSVLRDGVDDQPAATEATAGQVKEAKEYAIQVANAIVARQGTRPLGPIPGGFFQNGQAAALTLVARQVIPVATDLTEVSVQEEPGHGYRDGDIPAVLTQLAAGQLPDRAPELLEQYVLRNLQLDDQSFYNLARFHHRRAQIYADAIDRWEQILEGMNQQAAPSGAEGVRLWQDVLEERYRVEVRQALTYQAEVRATTTDPVLAGLAQDIPELPPQTTENPEAWHDPRWGTLDQPPKPTRAPDIGPWRRFDEEELSNRFHPSVNGSSSPTRDDSDLIGRQPFRDDLAESQTTPVSPLTNRLDETDPLEEADPPGEAEPLSLRGIWRRITGRPQP